MKIPFGLLAWVVLNFGLVPVYTAAKPKCSIHCAVELVDGCCPAFPDSSPIPAGGCEDISECARACTDGDGASCTRAGSLIRHFRSAEERDDMRVILFYDRGCRLGDGRGCWLGMQLERANYAALRDFESAVIADLVACQYGSASACSRLSDLHWYDGKFPVYAARACHLGARDDCIMLVKALSTEEGRRFSWKAHTGIGVGANNSKYDYLKAALRACEFAHYVPSCIELAREDFRRPLDLPPSKLIERQWKTAFGRLDPLCSHGEGSACNALATMNDELLERPMKPRLYDPALGPQLNARACELLEPKGCKDLGVALVRGRGTASDRTAAARALRKACDLRDGEACVILSQITTDRKQALALIREACIKGARGPTGEIFTNIGLPEYPQRFRCSGARRHELQSPEHAPHSVPKKQ